MAFHRDVDLSIFPATSSCRRNLMLMSTLGFFPQQTCIIFLDVANAPPSLSAGRYFTTIQPTISDFTTFHLAGSVLCLLDSNDLELRHLSLSILTNMLAFPDTPLVSREDCLYAVIDHLDKVTAAINTCDVRDLQSPDTKPLTASRLPKT